MHHGSGYLNIHLTSDLDLNFSHLFIVDSDNALVLQHAEVVFCVDKIFEVNHLLLHALGS